MKLAHLIAIIAFGLSFLFSGSNNYAEAVQVGANWGFWSALIVGGIGMIFVLAISVIATFAGGAIGSEYKGVIGMMIGSFGVGFIMIIIVLLSIAAFVLALYGYDALGAWGASGLEDKSLAIKAGVFLGLSLLLSILPSNSSASTSN